MDSQQVEKLENYQKLHWDVFYKNNNVNFYKDRHYIRYEFKELEEIKEEQKCLLDFGCGVGNGFYPLIEHFGYDKLRVNCCDLSKTAIRLVKEHEKFKEENVSAFQCDCVNDPIPFEPNTADYCLFLFVLSAISPDKHLKVMEKLGA